MFGFCALIESVACCALEINPRPQIVTSERIELAGDESPWSFKCFSLLQNPRRQLERVYELVTQLRAQIHEHCRIAEVWWSF